MWFLTEKKIPLKATLTFAASLKSAPHCARPNWIDCAFPWNWANLFDGPGVASTSVAGSPSNARPSNDNQFPHFIFFFFPLDEDRSTTEMSCHHWADGHIHVFFSHSNWPSEKKVAPLTSDISLSRILPLFSKICLEILAHPTDIHWISVRCHVTIKCSMTLRSQGPIFRFKYSNSLHSTCFTRRKFTCLKRNELTFRSISETAFVTTQIRADSRVNLVWPVPFWQLVRLARKTKGRSSSVDTLASTRHRFFVVVSLSRAKIDTRYAPGFHRWLARFHQQMFNTAQQSDELRMLCRLIIDFRPS